MSNRVPLARGPCALLLVLLVLLVTNCGGPVDPDPDPVPVSEKPPELFETARVDEVRAKQVHNSYQRFQPFEVQLSWHDSEPWKYSTSNIEIDLRIDPEKYLDGEWDWSISHVHFEPADEDRFASYLERIEAWSNANKGHRFVTVHLDMKDTPDDYIFEIGGGREQYVANMPDALDAFIAEHFDTTRLLKPADFITAPGDLVQGVMAQGWPTLGELHDKLLFVLGITGYDASVYSDQDPAERLCFAWAGLSSAFTDETYSTVASSGTRVFINRNIRVADGWQEHFRRIRAHGGYILRGFNVCQDADEDADPDCALHIRDIVEGEKWDSLELWSMAMTTGINLISTDMISEEDWATVGTCPHWRIPDAFWGYEKESLTESNGARTRSAPAAATFQDLVHVFLDREGGLEYLTWDESSWSGPYEVPGQPVGEPAVAICGDDLHLVSWNTITGSLVWKQFDGQSWSAGANLALASGPASLAACNGMLYAVYPVADGGMGYRIFNGTDWSTAAKVAGATSSALAADVLGGKVQVVWADEAGSLFTASCEGTSWSVPRSLTTLIGARTLHTPAVAAVGDHLEVAIRALDRNYPEKAQITCFSLFADGHVTGQSLVLGSETSAGVALVGLGSRCVMILKGKDDDSVWAQYQTVY